MTSKYPVSAMARFKAHLATANKSYLLEIKASINRRLLEKDYDMGKSFEITPEQLEELLQEIDKPLKRMGVLL